MQCGARRKKGGVTLGVQRKIYGSKRKSRRGGGYGFGGVMGTNGASWVANNTSGDGDGNPIPKPSGGRRKKSRKTRRKTRGGGSIATVGYGFTGEGVRGLGNVTGYNSNPPGPPGYMGK